MTQYFCGFLQIVKFFKFLSTKFAAFLEPPSRDNNRKASYLKTQQRDQGAG